MANYELDSNGDPVGDIKKAVTNNLGNKQALLKTLSRALKMEYGAARDGFARPLARGLAIARSPVDDMTVDERYVDLMKSAHTPGSKMEAVTDPLNVSTLLIPEAPGGMLARALKSATMGGSVAGLSEAARQSLAQEEANKEYNPASIAKAAAIGAGTAGLGGAISGKYEQLLNKAPAIDRAKSEKFIRGILENPTNDPDVQALIEASIKASKPKLSIGQQIDNKLNESLDKSPMTTYMVGNLAQAAVPLSPIAAKLYNDKMKQSKPKQDRLK